MARQRGIIDPPPHQDSGSKRGEVQVFDQGPVFLHLRHFTWMCSVLVLHLLWRCPKGYCQKLVFLCSQGVGLNENGPHRLMCPSVWFPARGLFRGD